MPKKVLLLLLLVFACGCGSPEPHPENNYSSSDPYTKIFDTRDGDIEEILIVRDDLGRGFCWECDNSISYEIDGIKVLNNEEYINLTIYFGGSMWVEYSMNDKKNCGLSISALYGNKHPDNYWVVEVYYKNGETFIFSQLEPSSLYMR